MGDSTMLDLIASYVLAGFIILFGLASIWLAWQKDKEENEDEQRR